MSPRDGRLPVARDHSLAASRCRRHVSIRGAGTHASRGFTMTEGAVSSHDRLYIGGAWAAPASDDRIEVISPVTEEVIATVPAGSRADIDRAVAAAHTALISAPWASTTLEDRIALLER